MGRKTFRIGIGNLSVVMGDGFRFPLTKKFFYLYAYLAYERKKNSLGREGFVDVDRIRHLPFWEKNNLASVGKQISRHITKMEKMDRNTIEAQQRVKGPFRLSADPGEILFDTDDESTRRFLGLDRLVVFYTEENEEIFYGYTEDIVEGDILFNEGKLEQALNSFHSAMKKSTTADHRVEAILRMGRTLDSLGDYAEASRTYKTAEEIIRKTAVNNYHRLADLYIRLGMVYYHQGKTSLAQKTFFTARDLIGEKPHNLLLGRIYNGLGIIYQASERYKEAIGFFKNSLSLLSTESDFYGVSAAYFNIGNDSKRMADELTKKRNGKVVITTEATNLYKKAIKWEEKSIELTRKACLGAEFSQERIVISYCYYRLGSYKKALEFAEEAKKMASDAGNKRDLALSYELIGKILEARDKDKRAEADEALKKSMELFRMIGNEPGIRRVTKAEERFAKDRLHAQD